MGDTSKHFATWLCGGLVAHWFVTARHWLTGPDCEVFADQGHEGKLAFRFLETSEQPGPREIKESAGLADWPFELVLILCCRFLA